MAICERCRQQIEEEQRNSPNPYARYADAIRNRIHIAEEKGMTLDGQG